MKKLLNTLSQNSRQYATGAQRTESSLESRELGGSESQQRLQLGAEDRWEPTTEHATKYHIRRFRLYLVFKNLMCHTEHFARYSEELI